MATTTTTITYFLYNKLINLQNASCDIYSFSILLGQMLTCEIPYEDFTTIREIQNYVWDAAEPTRPNLLLEGNSSSSMIPETLQYMIRQGWSGNPQMRPKLLEVSFVAFVCFSLPRHFIWFSCSSWVLGGLLFFRF